MHGRYLVKSGQTVGGASLILAAAMWLAGCSQQDFGRPLTSSIGGRGAKRQYAQLDAERARRAQLRTERLGTALAAWAADTTTAARAYTIGPNDVLAIAVAALEAPDETARLERTVGEDDTVNMPWIGSVSTRGLSVRQFEESLRDAYANRYLKDPRVSVAVSEYRSSPIVLTGAVRNPGVYYLKHNQSSILEVLSEAGGLADDAGDEIILVRGARSRSSEGPEAEFPLVSAATNRPAPPRPIPINLRNLVDEGDLRLNLWIRSGDVISVPTREKGYIYVVGYVTRPGAVETPVDVSLNALQAVTMAGGLTALGRGENSFYIRATERGQEIVPVDLTKLARGTEPPLYLQAGDTLVVGSSMWARMGEFVRPSLSAGMSVAPVP